MQLILENLSYQETAIGSVIKVFDGITKNTFDNACFDGIRANVCDLPDKQLAKNISTIIAENGIGSETAKLAPDNELCIEMETGTGKTLVYIKTIHELHKHYGFTKFIILVPSIAIRQGVLATFKAFGEQLHRHYEFSPNVFEYDSKKLSNVMHFVLDQHPQVMVMTLASFNSEDKILNQAQREDLIDNIPFIAAIGKTRPIIVMDEPQEGMDTDNSLKQIAKLNPLCKIRYSATHKVVKNLLYRLTPYDSYKQNLVKKIEVLTVTEKNDEATLKIALEQIDYAGGNPKAKLKAWHQAKTGNKFDFKATNWLKVGDNLGEKTNNPSYLNYQIERINKSLRTGLWSVSFTNGAEVSENHIPGNTEGIWGLQLEWLLRRHFAKSQQLEPSGIKCLSLIFIDKVANYMGETPVIKNLFAEKYREVYPEYHNGNIPSPEQIAAAQGYYFAQKASGEYADNEGGVKEQSKIYELILKGKEELLNITNSVQFIFSHSALGVGWDNPNVFNIATLNNAYSEIRKRQEIGRGLRICVNQHGHRVYDDLHVGDDKRINRLTVIPNETYETFVAQYQQEIKAVYGDLNAGAGFDHTHKGKPQNQVTFKRNKSETIDAAFKRFWKSLARQTDYRVAFVEENLVEKAVAALSGLTMPDYVLEASSHFIQSLSEQGKEDSLGGTDSVKQKANFAALDLIEELSENTGLSYPTVLKIMQSVTNHAQLVKNPPRYIHEAAAIIRNIELDEMLRTLEYHATGASFPFDFDDFVKNAAADAYIDTPNRGVFDKMLVDSNVERWFSSSADKDPEVVCFLKLPAWYTIKTPIGDYQPDFGVVLKRKRLKSGDEQEYYFVIETKGTNDLYDKKALTDSERYKIRCAIKHFECLGIDVQYRAPVKEYTDFKTQADGIINAS